MTNNNAEALRALLPALQSMRDRMLQALPPKFGDGFDGDMDTLLDTINAIKRASNVTNIGHSLALASQPQAAGAGGDAVRWAEKYLSNLQAGDHAPGDEVMAVLWAGLEALAATPAPAVEREAVAPPGYRLQPHAEFDAMCAAARSCRCTAQWPTPPAEAREPVGDGHPFAKLAGVMRTDSEYAWAFHCNLAMPIMDRLRCTHREANEAGADLMRRLFNVDVRAHPHWEYAAQPQATPREPVDDARAVAWDWRYRSNSGKWLPWNRIDRENFDELRQEFGGLTGVAGGVEYEIRALYTRPSAAPEPAYVDDPLNYPEQPMDAAPEPSAGEAVTPSAQRAIDTFHETLAKQDAVMYGTGYLVNGTRVAPQNVRVFTAAPEPLAARTAAPSDTTEGSNNAR